MAGSPAGTTVSSQSCPEDSSNKVALFAIQSELNSVEQD